jgi:3-deoxy-D-manno-octulosonic-acid transferase
MWLLLKFYSLIHLLLLPLIFPLELRKRDPKRRLVWHKEKFGFISSPNFRDNKQIIWVHAVSLGEVRAITKFLELATQEFNICLTTTTETGRTFAEKLMRKKPNLKVYYSPFDLEFVIKRFLKKINPAGLVLVETEIWPNMIHVSSNYMPVFLINARLSNKSFIKYKALSFFFKPILNKISAICVQDENYLHKFKSLGIIPDKLYLTGNLKFDITIPFIKFEELEILKRPIIIAGSTHEGEEKIILTSFLQIKEASSLLLVPRHPERFEMVYKLCQEFIGAEDVIVFKYSELLKNKPQQMLKDWQEGKKMVVVIDKIGILASLYRIADVAIIGGSFIPHGGQNPLEAIYWKVPVIVGPYMDNFPFVAEFVKEGAILQTTPEGLTEAIHVVLKDKEYRERLVEKAYAMVMRLTGGSKKTLEIINSFLKSNPKTKN